ncbi:MAG TPA: CHAP domain-containing protein [Candidatus Saccharimonadales bacterium]|nr:CHAP domain-containing protein [Candidatus Saccharimonadales bacterium]
MKQKQQKGKAWQRLRIVPVLTVISLLVIGSTIIPQVAADRFDEEIRKLQQQNAANQGALSDLQGQAASYQEVVNLLRAQIVQLEADIRANVQKQAELQAKIEEGQRELDRQRQVLGADIKAMYVDGDISTIEMLASSRNLSDFVDKESYRNAVQNKIQETLKRITKLQNELKQQKIVVDRMILDQQGQQQTLDARKREQAQLLAYNQQQQASYNSQIKDNNKKISDLKRQQVLENLRLFGGGTQPGIPGGGGYPWGNAYCVHTGRVSGDCWNYDWYFHGSAWDPWGYGFRNCTSWVAYKLAADGKAGFSQLGNANQWPGRAQARGIPVSTGGGARSGDAVVNPRGFYGHVMYVEAVLSDGRVVVSDYNRAGDGLYRGPDGGNASVLSQSGLVFIHF